MKLPVARVDGSGSALLITLDEAGRRFEISRDTVTDAAGDPPAEPGADPAAGDEAGSGAHGVLEFTRLGDVVSMNHTAVPRSLRGQGMGEALVRAALDYARAQGWRIRPRCPYVAAFISAHPEYASLVATG